MTGQGLYDLIKESIDYIYSDWPQVAQAQRLLNDVFFRAVEKEYRGLNSQKQFDEITSLIKTDEEITVLNDVIHLNPLQIDTISTNGSVASVTTRLPHRITTGDLISVSGVLGSVVTNINLSNVAATVTGTRTFTYPAAASALTGYTDDSGQVRTVNMFPSEAPYYHFFFSRCRIIDTTSAKSITAATTGADTELTFASHNFRNGDLVYVTALTGTSLNTAAYYTVTVTSRTKISLGVSSTGTYTSGATASIAYNQECTPYYSDRKGQLFGQPTANQPKFQTADVCLKYYPTGINQVTIDYMCRPQYVISLSDNVVELELYYSPKFLDFLVQEFTIAFSGETRDGQRFNSALTEQQMNP